jgi:uncharacterized protein YndB with AHSA1/START domain
MTERSVVHATFVIERSYDAPPARVFAACSDPAAKKRWFVGPENWDKSDYRLDFRVGGEETTSGGAEGGPLHKYWATIRDIVPDRRIVSTYEMAMDDTRTSVSVATVELMAEGNGTRLIFTEQGAYFDGLDKPEWREQGTRDLFDKLGAALARETASA